ncbi:MAG: hypothetical protein U0V48_10105 [Anaerolineales bacterium]
MNDTPVTVLLTLYPSLFPLRLTLLIAELRLPPSRRVCRMARDELLALTLIEKIRYPEPISHSWDCGSDLLSRSSMTRFLSDWRASMPDEKKSSRLRNFSCRR